MQVPFRFLMAVCRSRLMAFCRVPSVASWLHKDESASKGSDPTLIPPESLTAELALTGLDPTLILPQEMASSGRAPESLPSNSWAVFTNTVKSAPLRWSRERHVYSFRQERKAGREGGKRGRDGGRVREGWGKRAAVLEITSGRQKCLSNYSLMSI